LDGARTIEEWEELKKKCRNFVGLSEQGNIWAGTMWGFHVDENGEVVNMKYYPVSSQCAVMKIDPETKWIPARDLLEDDEWRLDGENRLYYHPSDPDSLKEKAERAKSNVTPENVRETLSNKNLPDPVRAWMQAELAEKEEEEGKRKKQKCDSPLQSQSPSPSSSPSPELSATRPLHIKQCNCVPGGCGVFWQ